MDLKVMVGCPIRNRDWILPAYLDALENLDYAHNLLEFCFIVNDCNDETPALLQAFAGRSTVPVRIVTEDSDIPSGHRRGYYNLRRLAYLRNCLLDAFLQSDCDCLFSLDSDILAPARALKDLLADGCEVVSALVCNGHQIGDEGIYNILRRKEDGHYVHWRDFPRDRVFQVDCTGAAYLIHRRVVEKEGVRYTARLGAEDIGFCEMAREKGIKIFCDGRIECRHIMQEPDKNSAAVITFCSPGS